MLCAGFAAPGRASDVVWMTNSDSQTSEPESEQDGEAPADEADADEYEDEAEIFSDQADDLPGMEETSAAAEWTYPVVPSELMSDYVRLVNADNLLEPDYVPGDLVKIKVKKTSSTAIQMRQVASDALDRMFADALAAGLTLYAHSGYRAYQTQKTMYYNRLEKNNGVDDGYVTKPGASDHQTGLGIDVISKAWIGKKFNSEFAKTEEAQWMAAYCADYGFIIRYPEDKVDITQIAYEPWHLRYVGPTAARYIMGSGMALEEFNEEWQPILQAFREAGGDVSAVVAEVVETADGLITMMPKLLNVSVYRTDIQGADGDYEYSLFAPEDAGEGS